MARHPLSIAIMVTDKHTPPLSTEQQRPNQLPSLASLRCLPNSALSATFTKFWQAARTEALRIEGPDGNTMVLMSAAAYVQATARIDSLLSMMTGRLGEQLHAAEPSDPDVVFQDDAECWVGLKQISRLERRALKWERARDSDTETLGAVFAKACEVFEHVVPAIDWLSRPNPLLGGAKPSHLVATNVGAQRVLNALSKIEYGIPV